MPWPRSSASTGRSLLAERAGDADQRLALNGVDHQDDPEDRLGQEDHQGELAGGDQALLVKATDAGRRRAIRALSMSEGDVSELSAKLHVAKRRVYRRTLLELARQLGYDIPRPALEERISDAIEAEARDHAERIADHYNADLARKAAELAPALAQPELEAALRSWARLRQRRRAQATAITEAYSAHADAVLGFARDLGIEAEFDFGTHPDDQAPVCEICIELVAGNPWPLEAVAAIGTPHIGCRQSWQIRVDQRELPPELPPLGQTLGGIVGGEGLLARHRNDREAAAAEVRDRREAR
jgi:hypothetical protein